MAALKEDVKLFIVQCLACYDTPSKVVDSVKEQFEIPVTRPQVQAYDPTKKAGEYLSQKFKDIFFETRKAFLDESIEVPIANKIFRLRSLQSMHDYYVSRKNFVQAQSVLEQAAKEIGNMYVGRNAQINDGNDPFSSFLARISGTSLPVVQDTSRVVEHELLPDDDDEPITDKPVKASTPPKKPRVSVERD